MKLKIIFLSIGLFLVNSVEIFSQRNKVKSSTGIYSTAKSNQIRRINQIIKYKNANNYEAIVNLLKKELIKVGSSKFERQHLLNELVDIYTYHTLDIEQAYTLDIEISNLGVLPHDHSYFLNHTAAQDERGSVILISNEYRENYINVSSQQIIEIANKRLKKNHTLLQGERPKVNKKYTIERLTAGLQNISRDLNNAVEGTDDYYELISRLIRYEYEAFKVSGDIKYIKSYSFLLTGKIKLQQIFLKEISYLKLSEYFEKAYEGANEIRLLELAFLTINKPYLKLREEKNKIQYSVLINQIIDKIVDAYFERKEYVFVLFFSSMNKARVLAEESLKSISLNHWIQGNAFFKLSSYTDLASKKKQFRQYLFSQFQADAFIDFYIQIKHTQAENSSFANQGITRLDQPPLNKKIQSNSSTQRTRAVFNEEHAVRVYDQNIVSIYVSTITNGNIRVQRIISQEVIHDIIYKVDELHENLNIIRNRPLPQFMNIRNSVEKLRRLLCLDENLATYADLYISCNGNLTKLPFSFVLDRPIVRVLSLFTFSKIQGLLSRPAEETKILGFFNPSLDLKGAEKELATINNLFPNSSLFKREDAKKELLLKTSDDANIIHISTHGYHNANHPDSSFLVFAPIPPNQELESIISNLVRSSQNIITASEIKQGTYNSLQNKDLIFLGACQLGLSERDKNNQTEVQGLIRPLLMGNNSNIIMALWNVSDEATLLFVKYFYENLKMTENIVSAYKFAINNLKAKFPEVPSYWSAFYLVSTGNDSFWMN